VHLVEVLVATAVFASAMAALPAVFALSAHANADAAATTWATMLAAQKVEEIRSRPFPASPIAPDVELLDAAGRLVAVSRAAPAYRRTARVDRLNVALPETVLPQTVVITVVVSRHPLPAAETGTDRRGTVRLVTLRTRTTP
jgi:Tfp pilus assembly protein PilV